MKICGISDIHGEFIDTPVCDVLCICGDIVGLNDQRSLDASRKWWYNRFTSWVNRQPCDKVIITPGNHDFFLEDAYKKGYYKELQEDLSVRTNGKLVILINEEYTYNGIKFYGCPYINPITFQEGRWAFEDNYRTLGDLETCYNIPNNIDILLTHDNPYENEILYNSLTKSTIQYHFFGHWHDGADSKEKGHYNCSMLNDMYNRKKGWKPIEIEIMTPSDKIEINKEYLSTLIYYFRAFSALKGGKIGIDEVKEFFALQKEQLGMMSEEDKVELPVTGEEIEDEPDTEDSEESEGED